MKELFGKFSMDTIASCAFGVDAQSFTSAKKSEGALPFVKNATALFSNGTWEMIKFLLVLLPGGRALFSLFGISLMKAKEIFFFRDVIRQTLNDRLSSNVKKNDLIDLMISAMKNDANSAPSDEPEDQFGKVTFESRSK